MLSAEQVGQFRRDGYLAVADVLDEAMLAEARCAIDELVEQSRNLTDGDSTFVLGSSHSRQSPWLERINQPVTTHLTFDRIMRSAAVLDRVAQLIGPDIRYHHSKLNMKV